MRPPKNQTFLGRLVYEPFFSRTQLDALMNYKNTGEDLSLTYRYVMTPLYKRLINYIPLSLAPNLITLMGTLCVVFPHLLLVSYSYDIQTPAPSFVYALNGLGIFCYMILDNLDGRQARRTGMSSPLGHLFDHGCDALNVTIAGLTVAASLRLGGGSGMMSLLPYWVVWTLGQFVCYMATLEEFFTGSMILRQINGPNEGIIVIVLFLLLTSITGPQFWDQSYALPNILQKFVYLTPLSTFDTTKGLPLKYFVCLLPFPLCIPTSFLNLYEVWRNGHRQKNRSGWKDLITALSYSFNFIVLSIAVFTWLYVTPRNFPYKSLLLIWLSGACFFHIVSRLILAHLTGIKFPIFLKMLVPLCLGSFNAVVGTVIRGKPFLDDRVVFGAVYGITMVFNAWRIYCMITQVCWFLGIRCFRAGKLDDNTEEKDE